MASVTDPVVDSGPDQATSVPTWLTRLRIGLARHPWVLVTLPFAAFYVFVAVRQKLPVFFPDEYLYGHLARSTSEGHGLTWRGDAIELRSALYVYLISPSWLVASGMSAYGVAKVESALLACSVAIPVWALAREIMRREVALLTVAVSLAGTWMTAGLLLTESVALPLATAALVSTVLTMRSGSRRMAWLALVLAVASAWARLQLLVLLPVIGSALLLDVLRDSSARRIKLRVYRGPLAALTVLLLIGSVSILLNRTTLLGGYNGITGYRPGVADVAAGAGLQLLHLAALSGLLPPLLLGVIALRPRAWRDDTLGPLLAVLLPLVTILAVENGFFVRGFDAGLAIQRYMIYAAPMLLIFAIVAFARADLVRWRTLAVVGSLSSVFFLTPKIVDREEQRAAFATAERVNQWLPSFSPGTSLALVAAGLCLVAVVVLRLTSRRTFTLTMASLLLAMLAVQSVTVAVWQNRVALEARQANYPHDLQWIDHHSQGPVAVLNVTEQSGLFSALDFFNKNVTGFYNQHIPMPGLPVAGRICAWGIGNDGSAVFDDACPPRTQEFLLADPLMAMKFRNEVRSVSEPHIGRLVTVRGTPKLLSAIQMPCRRKTIESEPVTLKLLPDEPVECNPVLIVSLWPEASATLAVGFRGAARRTHSVTIGRRTLRVPPRTLTTARVGVNAGYGVTEFGLDWQRAGRGDPAVVSAELRFANGVRTSLL